MCGVKFEVGQHMELAEYVEMYRKMHADPNLYEGSAFGLHASNIHGMLVEHQAQTLLDYGCGKGIQYFKEKSHVHYLNNIMPALYDPAVKEFSQLPDGKFDGTICTDVLEHIDEAYIPGILSEIFDKSTKFAYLGICTSLADSFLPDGRNSHITIKPASWWADIITQINPSIHVLVYCYGNLRGFSIHRDGRVTVKER